VITRAAMRTARAVTLTALVISSGCAGSVTGELDGTNAPGFSEAIMAFYSPLADGTQRMFVHAVTFGGACETLTRVADQTERATDAWFDDLTEYTTRNLNQDELDGLITTRSNVWHEELDQLHRDNYPETWWSMQQLVYASSRGDYEGEKFDIQDAATIQICEHFAYPSHAAAFDAPSGDAAAQQQALGVRCFTGQDGDLEIGVFEDDGRVEITGDAEMVDVDEADAGDIEFSVNAPWCEDFEDELD
jgi:hypothetical protein